MVLNDITLRSNIIRIYDPSLFIQIKDENTRKAIADVMATALTSLDKAAIDLYISQSSSDERATVMKYVCRCMADGDRRTCDTLLAWHAKLVEKDGHGIILRVMTERRV